MQRKTLKLTLKKNLDLTNIASTINKKIDILETSDDVILTPLPENRLIDIQTYKDCYDVLITIVYRSNPIRLKGIRYNQDIDWNNEYDIPIDVYMNGINTAINYLNQYNKHGYGAELYLLEELLEFRMKKYRK